MTELLTRLDSLLAALPLGPDLPPRVLNVGCGAYSSAATLRAALPGWVLWGLDLDGQALRRAHVRAPDLRLIQADARHLPDLLAIRFGLVLVRHPDLAHPRAAWSLVLPALPRLLEPGGLLLITVFAAEEAGRVRALPLPPTYPLDESTLAPVDLSGCDRLALAYLVRSHRLDRV